ncbi:MAG: RluA family pseudouridine synthase [Candidatus Alcyoniella australis]|nr:RluA family pseudouridine synthase [Candidatus Alcyoniella australis]
MPDEPILEHASELPVEEQFVVSDAEQGLRLDRFVQQRLPEHSRSEFKRLINEGLITVDGQTVKPAQSLRTGQRVAVQYAQPEPIEPQPEQIEINVLFEDCQMIVVNKAAGMVVHPAAGHSSGTLVNALLHHCEDLSGIGGKLRPGIVHRLDKGTSGVMVVAKNDFAHNKLSLQFKEREVGKRYLALCWSAPRDDRGSVIQPIGRHPVDRQRMAVLEPGKGRFAHTDFRVLERHAQTSLLELVIHTGRTHQIRVHLAWLDCPVLGDELYGGARKTSHLKNQSAAQAVRQADRPLLHAAALSLKHPGTGESMSFEAPLPDQMQRVLELLREGR